MAIKYNGNAVEHIKKDGQWVEELNYGGNIVWEETYGVYKLGDLPTNMASLTCYRVSQDPAVRAGYITHNADLYNKDKLTIIAKGSGWYGVSMTSYPTDTGYADITTPLYTPAISEDERSDAFAPLERFAFNILDRRNVYLDFSSNINGGITCTYGDPYTHAAKSVTKTDDYSFLAYNGTEITWTADPDYDRDVALEEVSGTIPTGASAARIKPVALTYSWNDVVFGGYKSTYSFTNLRSKTTASLSSWYPGCMGSYRKLRVSGTYTITPVTGAPVSSRFDNMQLSTTFGATSYLFQDTVGPTTVQATITHDTNLTITVTLVNSSTYPISSILVTLTSVEAYIPFSTDYIAGQGCEISHSDYDLYVYNIPDSRTLLFNGEVEWSGARCSLGSTFQNLGTGMDSVAITPTMISDASKDQQTLESFSVFCAIGDAETGMALSPMFCADM